VEFDVTFVGQAYGDRPEYIQRLLDSNIDVRVWGYGWDKFSQNYQSQVANPVKRLARTVREFWSNTDVEDVFRRLLNLQLLASARETVLQVPSTVLPGEIIGGVLSDLDMIQMYSRSKINLGFSSCNTDDAEERLKCR
jgi:hypothetical protein